MRDAWKRTLRGGRRRLDAQLAEDVAAGAEARGKQLGGLARAILTGAVDV